jgi:hypothetical protein
MGFVSEGGARAAVEDRAVEPTNPGDGMVLAVTFWSQPQVVTDSWVELASTITLIAFVIGVYRHLECHKTGCHRLGRFAHGRYKLCHVHHPLVPDDGKITQEEIASVDVGQRAGGTRDRHARGAPGNS